MRRWLLLLLLVPLAGLPPARAASDLDDLRSEYDAVRRRAVARLARAGEGVEARLLKMYESADYRTRSAILDVLAVRGSAAALPRVLENLGAGSRSVREAQARYLVALGEPGRDALDEILSGDDAVRAARARRILALTVRTEVERKIIDELNGPQLHYEGQFASLLRDRDLAVDVLMEMVANDHGGYRFTIPVALIVDLLDVRAKAADALTDVGRKSDIPRVRERLAQVRREIERTQNYIEALRLEDLAEVLCYVLHDLGDPEPAEELARNLWDRTRGSPYLWGTMEERARFGLALLMARMGRLRQSGRIYEEILADVRPSARLRHGAAAYNLACVYGLMGRVEDAYGMLLDAVQLDPMAVNAALEDGDLRSVREAMPDLERRLMAVSPPMPGDEFEDEADAPEGDEGR